MKKLLSFLAVALLMAAQATAQTAFATLIHEGTLSSFTGVDALKDAAAAAADGDVITLSSGTFNGCTITKAITLKGAGMEADELGRQSIIKSDIYLGGSPESISIEGIRMTNNNFICTSGNIGTVFLNKCIIREYTIGAQYAQGEINLSFITNCKFNKLAVQGHGKGHFTIYNSYINNIMASDNSCIYNCIITEVYGGSNYNCIIMGNIHNTGSIYHCVYSKTLTGNNYQVEDVKTIFNNYDENATWYTRDLTLTDEAKATYLGNEGTEVGIYGGSLPFSPWLDRPFIKRLNVAPKSTRAGKLSVDIEVDENE